jgi:hypothetical protein
MAHRVDELNFTAARHISADRVKRYLVWTRRGSAVACYLYQAESSAAAIQMARAELELFEAMANSI